MRLLSVIGRRGKPLNPRRHREEIDGQLIYSIYSEHYGLIHVRTGKLLLCIKLKVPYFKSPKGTSITKEGIPSNPCENCLPSAKKDSPFTFHGCLSIIKVAKIVRQVERGNVRPLYEEAEKVKDIVIYRAARLTKNPDCGAARPLGRSHRLYGTINARPIPKRQYFHGGVLAGCQSGHSCLQRLGTQEEGNTRRR